MSNSSKKLILNSLSAAVMLACSSQAAQAYNPNHSITNALKLGQEDARYGKFKVNLRYRYELADVESTVKNTAHANTLRLRLGYLTPIFSGFQGFVEYEGNLAMQQDYLSPKGNWKGDTTRDVIPDPQSSELNRFWVSYKGFGSEIKGGRQRIILDDSRFIGNVGWRQMEQTYDAITFTNKSIDNMTFKAGYIGQVQDIFSRNIDLDVVFLNLNYKVNKHATVSGYTYLVSYENAAAASTKTFGLKVNGSPKINQDLKLHYTAEYSNQSQYVNNPNTYNVDRYNLMVGATFRGVTFKTGIEELGSNGTQSFQTPLGTNHKFQGWADRFVLGTPGTTGVRDVTANLSSKVAGTKLMFVYHNFQSATGNIEYGNEYDFLVTRKFGKHFSLLAKYAFYDADNSSNGNNDNDIHKFWLQASLNY